ncbi:MAG: ASKHA domain-containing protein [Treponema sp.]|nr:ASKHA domain-containing protein [Treponema sp.]
MKISLHNSPVICNAQTGESVLLACARAGFILSAPCGGRRRCGKCKVRLLDGRVGGDTPDSEGWVRACAAVPLTDITIDCGEITAAENGHAPTERAPAERRFAESARTGVALDIGTTTVSARLIDVDTALALDTISVLNDQRSFGADVMSRVSAAQKGKTAELFTLINRQTQRILELFQQRNGIQTIEHLAVSGNTVMLHLFLNVDPSGMGKLPFSPVFLAEKMLKGEVLALSVENITVLPSIAAFIGGDITAGLAALDIMNIPGPSLFIDIGTNGEMALVNRGNIICCSTAAGPAFEGAEISCGMGGVAGAISGVEWNGNSVSVTTIGNVPPVGICGSGLVDAVAVMLKQGIIDETGFMADSAKGFYPAPGIGVSAADIRQFQLAKSAILSGIKILCKNAGLHTADIRQVFVAGGFGFFINKQNAVTTGIFPPEFFDRLSVCGNLSLQGAAQCLVTENFLGTCRQIAAQCSVIDLAADPSFMDEFAQNMLFN